MMSNNVMKMSKSKRKCKSSTSSDLKVVYISTPMKVKTSASNFRTTVQQLTGRDSDLIDRLMDEYANNNTNEYNNIVDVANDVLLMLRTDQIPEISDNNSNSYESPTSSGSMAFEGLMLSDGGGGGGGGEGFDGGFSFEEIFGAAGFLLECPVDEASQFR